MMEANGMRGRIRMGGVGYVSRAGAKGAKGVNVGSESKAACQLRVESCRCETNYQVTGPRPAI